MILDQLIVAPEHSMRGYVRDRFGKTPWRDTDRNGCDQRYDVLVRDAGSAATDAKPGRCKVTAISLLDPYTGETLTSINKIQIDHVVPLAAAWRAGADTWTAEAREAYATDESNLLAVKGTVNEAKGDQTPDRWTPPRLESHCQYAMIYIGTSAKYHLTVTAAIRAALIDMLRACVR